MRTAHQLSLHFATALPAAMASSFLEALYLDTSTPCLTRPLRHPTANGDESPLEYSNSWKIDKLSAAAKPSTTNLRRQFTDSSKKAP